MLLIAGGLCALDKLVRRSPGHEVLISWYAATMLFLLFHVPVFTHHLVLAAGPAVLLIVLERSEGSPGVPASSRWRHCYGLGDRLADQRLRRAGAGQR